MEFQLLSTTVGEGLPNPCTTVPGNNIRHCCSDTASKLCSYVSGIFTCLFFFSMCMIISSVIMRKKCMLFLFEVLLFLWLGTRIVSLYFFQRKSPLDYSTHDDSYAAFVTFQEIPVFFFAEAALCKVLYFWTEYKKAMLDNKQ